MSLSFLLFLAHLAARALALVGGRRFARVARKGTLENEHMKALVRRLHAKGKLGGGAWSFVETMKQLCMAVSMVAHFTDLRSAERWMGPPLRRRFAPSTLRAPQAHASVRHVCDSS